MSWTDNKAIEQMKLLRDEFQIKNLIETGSFKGINAELHIHNFVTVTTIESNYANYKIVKNRIDQFTGIRAVCDCSWDYLNFCRIYYPDYFTNSMLYLDAHFFNPSASNEDRWVVVKELKALKGVRDCIIIIHDFKCSGLGHLIYDGEALDWSVVNKYLYEVNSNFHFYVNTREHCDINTEETVHNLPITVNEDVIDAIRFVNSSDVKRYRGILYAVPRELDLVIYDLIEFNRLSPRGN